MDKKASYKDSGVSIDEGNRAVSLISGIAGKTFTSGVIRGIGGFSSLFRLDRSLYKDPVLVSGTDGVGTKLKIAFSLDIHNTVGIDLVAMCVNDILTSGAEPLFFLDYIATGKLRAEQVLSIVEGISEGCCESNMALLGGETAEMPSFYGAGEYDLAGFAVGVVDFSDIIDGSRVEEGDIVLGIPSSGFHSNGYSLIRHVLFELNDFSLFDRVEGMDESIGECLLRSTRIYYKELKSLRVEGIDVRGLAHVTGGGLRENLMRVVPKGLGIEFYERQMPFIFKWLQDIGSISYEEMERTFNLGIGMALIVPSSLRSAVYGVVDDVVDLGRVILV